MTSLIRLARGFGEKRIEPSGGYLERGDEEGVSRREGRNGPLFERWDVILGSEGRALVT